MFMQFSATIAFIYNLKSDISPNILHLIVLNINILKSYPFKLFSDLFLIFNLRGEDFLMAQID